MAVRSSRIQVGLALLFLLGSLPALAGPKEEAARAEVAAGTAAYNLGYYDDAARHYEEAYRQVPDPALLFNVGQAYRLAGKPDRAITAYRSYLRTSPPDAANRAQVEKRIPELEKLVAEMRSAQTAPPPGTLPATSPATTPPAVPVQASVPAPVAAPPAAQSPAGATPAAVSPVGVEPTAPGANNFPEFGTPPSLPPAASGTQPAADVTWGTDLHAAAPAPTGESPPVYKRWWFWTGLGAVVAAGVVTAVVLSSGSSKGIPGTKLGNQPIFQ
jgi:tetratricopeptide (TPR) repeat protein